MDFHACRLVYDNALIALNATTKETMELMRHSTPTLSLKTYGRAVPDRLRHLADEVDARLFPAPPYAPAMHAMAAGAEDERPIACDSATLAAQRVVAVTGFEPVTPRI